MSIKPEAASPRESLSLFREIFELESVCFLNALSGDTEICGTPSGALVQRTKETVALGHDVDDAVAGISVRLIRIGGETLGALGFQGLTGPESVSGHLAMLAAAAIERSRSFQAASRASAAAQAEVLRTAIVDAFAHQFNTPIAAILTAAGGIQQAGPLMPTQWELIRMIETEALRVGRLSTRLLHTARLNQDEIQPTLQPTDVSALITRMVDQCRLEGRALSLRLPEVAAEVASDRELLDLALSLILDNAFKYGGGPVDVLVHAGPDTACIRISNRGACISPDEHDRIFERFYRGAASRDSAGTGLGLYVARKILTAHGGQLCLEDDGSISGTTTFGASLPVLKTEVQYARKAS